MFSLADVPATGDATQKYAFFRELMENDTLDLRVAYQKKTRSRAKKRSSPQRKTKAQKRSCQLGGNGGEGDKSDDDYVP